MKYLAAIVVIYAFANFCIVAGMDFDLEPTPLAYQPFVLKHQAQARDPCTISCDYLAYYVSSANDASADASSTAAAVSSISNSALAQCSQSGYGLGNTVQVTIGGACPDNFAIIRIQSTSASIQHSKMELTATTHSSVN